MPELLSPTTSVLMVLLATSVLMTLGWLWQWYRRNATIVDAIWSTCMGASAIFYAVVGSGPTSLRIVVAILGGLWGGRLALHLVKRTFSEDEDGRYQYLRKHWNGSQARFFGFFMLQAVITALFSLPFMAVAWNVDGPPGWAWMVAGIIWLVSVGGEALADRQLARFRGRSENRGKTCREGLWHYSRHPNYFFEWTHWFAYLFLALGSHLFWLSLVGPVLMLLTLYRVSGIPFTEEQALRSRGDDYRAYQRTTSAFVPWFPKKDAPQ